MGYKTQLPWDLWLHKQPCPQAAPLDSQQFTAMNPCQLCFNYYCSMVRGRLQRNYHACIRRVTRPQAYWPCQHRLQAYKPCQYAPAQHHDRWPARDQGCNGRTSRDTPANCSSRSRHNDAEILLRGKRSNRVVYTVL